MQPAPNLISLMVTENRRVALNQRRTEEDCLLVTALIMGRSTHTTTSLTARLYRSSRSKKQWF